MKYAKAKGKGYRRSALGTFYLNAHPDCEVCGQPTEELHHLITRKTGGPDEEWNWLALCKVCHMVFHNIGRYSFALRYPIVYDKIKAACDKMGRKLDKEGKK